MKDKEHNHISGRKVRGDMKVKNGKSRIVKQGITKKEFHAILDKASQPIKREAESDQAQP